MFALIGNDSSGKSIISVKHTPESGEQLRDKYPEIVAGYYLNKTHWSSMDLSGNVPEDVLKQMLDCSYDLIFNSLSRKVQTEILNQ
jgi:predicted DNA-binding protein (MmcQ/YjbR family)